MMQFMNIGRKEAIQYTALFTGLGIFSYLLLVNFTHLPDSVADEISSVGIVLFFILTFNLLGYATLHISTWINQLYARNLRNRWKIIATYLGVVLTFLLLNYSLLVVAKLLMQASQPFVFPNGGWKILIVVWLVELIILGLVLANRSMKQSLILQKQASKLQKENNTARYTALQQQLNPHFLFNSLNTLIAEINYNPQNAVRFTQKLSDVYRYVLQCQDKNLVSLADELTFLKAYLFLHEVRLGDCIHCDIKISERYQECMLPPLTLQLLIENVIKHNSISQSRIMHIDIYIKDNMLVVANPIVPKKNNAPSGVGLNNLSNRCQLMIGKDIKVENNDGTFTVKVPLAL